MSETVRELVNALAVAAIVPLLSLPFAYTEGFREWWFWALFGIGSQLNHVQDYFFAQEPGSTAFGVILLLWNVLLWAGSYRFYRRVERKLNGDAPPEPETAPSPPEIKEKSGLRKNLSLILFVLVGVVLPGRFVFNAVFGAYPGIGRSAGTALAALLVTFWVGAFLVYTARHGRYAPPPVEPMEVPEPATPPEDAEEARRQRRSKIVIFTACFVIFILLPLIRSFTEKDPEENQMHRTLAFTMLGFYSFAWLVGFLRRPRK